MEQGSKLVKKAKKRQREVSNTESEDEYKRSLINELSNLQKQAIRSPKKTLKREIQTPQREIKRETKTPSRELPVPIKDIKREIKTPGNTESSSSDTSDSDGGASTFRIQSLKVEKSSSKSNDSTDSEKEKKKISASKGRKRKKSSSSESETDVKIKKRKKQKNNPTINGQKSSQDSSDTSLKKITATHRIKRELKTPNRELSAAIVNLKKKGKRTTSSSPEKSNSSSDSESRNSFRIRTLKATQKKAGENKTREDISETDDSSKSEKEKPKVSSNIINKTRAETHHSLSGSSKALETNKSSSDSDSDVSNIPDQVSKRVTSSLQNKSLHDNDSDLSSNEDQRMQDEKEVKKIEEKIQRQNKTTINVLQDIKFIPKKPMEQLREMHPNLKKIILKGDINIANYDLYLLKVPKTVDANIFLNTRINPSEINKIKVGNKKYILESTDKLPDPKLLILANGNKVVSLKSTIFLKKYLKPSKMPDISVPENSIVPFPNNLKERHPLFGSNFEDKIQVNKQIQEQLDLAKAAKLKEETKSIKSKKKKKRKEEDKNEVIFDLLRSGTSSKPEKQHDNDEIDDSAYSSSGHQNQTDSLINVTFSQAKVEIMSGGSQSSRKKKKHKKDKELNIENSDLTSDASTSPKKKKHIKEKLQLKIESQSMSNESISFKKKKHKRDKEEL